MKRTKQTALTAAVFAAALGVSQTGSTVSAVTDFSPESQQTAAVLYGPPPITVYGDGDGNNITDARDLTLLKRRLIKEISRTKGTRILHEHYAPNYSAAFNPAAMDLDRNNFLDPADVRELRNRLTGQQEPTKFTAEVWPVPFFSDEKPESPAEQEALLAQASDPDTIACYDFYVLNSGSANAVLQTGGGYYEMHCLSPFTLELDFSAVPDQDDPLRTSMKAAVLLRADIYGLSCEDGTMPQDQRDGDIRFDLDYITRKVQEDGTVRYYDKMQIEYNMLTGEIRIGSPAAQDELLTPPDFGTLTDSVSGITG